MAYIDFDLSLIDDCDLEQEMVKRLRKGDNPAIDEIILYDDLDYCCRYTIDNFDNLSDSEKLELSNLILDEGVVETNMYDTLKREHIESVFNKYSLDELYKSIP